jgi:hypothetical protein
MRQNEAADLVTVAASQLDFNNTFHENYALIKILSRDIFVSMFIKELCGRFQRYKFLNILHIAYE